MPRPNAHQDFAKQQDLLQSPTSGKKRGELAELAFLHKAVSLGFPVSKTYGDSDRFDFIVHSGPRFLKVQVKSSSQFVHGSYPINAKRRVKDQLIPYTPAEIDFLAAYIAPEDAWFIIPIQALKSRTSFRLYPQQSAQQGPFEQFREAWYLMG
jgi:hypothetical protein